MKRTRNWIIGIVLAGTAGFVALQNAVAPPNEVVEIPITTNTSTIEITETPTYAGCGYMWAYQDAPELTEKVDTAIRALNPDASARAELFGEDCIYADGTATFSAMETDFRVKFPVENLTDEEALGNWITQIMLPVIQIPEDEIQGNYGFVEISFIKSESEQVVLQIPIKEYIFESNTKSGAELFQFFNTPRVNPT